jgi:ABC-type nitrate/sulfonate/bicarbonate transport system substrate-binding protein
MTLRTNGGIVRAALACAIAASAFGSAGAADTTLVVGKAAATADPIIAVNVGDKKGFFKKHGIDVKILDFTGGSKMTQAMVAGSIDIGDGAGTEIAHIAKGAPMMAVCENTTTLPFISIGVPYDSPLKSIKELKGKKVGVSTPGSLTDWLAKELEQKEGWGPDALTRVAIGNAPTASTAAFRDHLLDADIGGTSTFLAMEEKKVGRVLAPVTSYEGPVASGTLFASNRLIESNPEALRAFLAGWIETTTFIRTNKPETVKIEREVTGFSETVQSREYDIVTSMFTKDCRFDPESLATLKRSFVELGLLDAPPDMSKLYTEAYLPK